MRGPEGVLPTTCQCRPSSLLAEDSAPYWKLVQTRKHYGVCVLLTSTNTLKLSLNHLHLQREQSSGTQEGVTNHQTMKTQPRGAQRVGRAMCQAYRGGYMELRLPVTYCMETVSEGNLSFPRTLSCPGK